MPASYRASVGNSYSSTPEGTSLSLDTHYPQTSSNVWQNPKMNERIIIIDGRQYTKPDRTSSTCPMSLIRSVQYRSATPQANTRSLKNSRNSEEYTSDKTMVEMTGTLLRDIECSRGPRERLVYSH